MDIGLIRRTDIDKEMQQAYLDYAMSVIVSRALPDARDGLKPVHRRILYAMHDMGLQAETTYKKSARIVGEVLGKYHPHSDTAVYDAMARMVQDFSLRYPLVDGQGNFGSVDGDPPAAMRYTEARIASPAQNLLADIQKNTVDFKSNFDDTLTEPSVLPASMPNLLINGATGIAVGMATSVPPHNLGEVADALTYMLNRWEKLDDINVDNLMQFIKGPDFPTGGVIIQSPNGSGLKSAYGSGRGRITVQSRAHTEEMVRGRKRIIVTELPYLTNKSSLIERIATLARDGHLEGIADLRDESDRDGMRIVIELTKTADADDILRALFDRTPMQSTFSIINLALVDGEPRLLSLKQALRVYLTHRLDVVRRRTEFDLKKARARSHVLVGLRLVLKNHKNLDDVINLIRRAPDVETARSRLRRRFKLSEIQAQAVLNMPLRRLASLERKKIELEHKELIKQINYLEGLLRSPKKIRNLIIEELQKIKEDHGDRRRTQIVRLDKGKAKAVPLTATDITPEKQVWVTVAPQNLVSRTLTNRTPRLSGRAAPGWLLRVNTRDTLYLVAENGSTAAIGVHTIPEAEIPADGTEVHNLSPLKRSDKLAAVFNLPSKDQRAAEWFVTTISRGGMVKKTAICDVPGPTAHAFKLAKVNKVDCLGWVYITDGKLDLILATAKGMTIRFSETEVRAMGLAAVGVKGIKLKVGDEVVGAGLLPPASSQSAQSKIGDVFLIRADGQAKRVKVNQFPKRGRYGTGVVAWKLPVGAQLKGMAIGKGTLRVIVHLSKLAAKAIRLDSAPIRERPENGKTALSLKAGDQILRIVTPMQYPRPVVAKKPTKRKPTKRKPKTTTRKITTRRRGK